MDLSAEFTVWRGRDSVSHTSACVCGPSDSRSTYSTQNAQSDRPNRRASARYTSSISL